MRRHPNLTQESLGAQHRAELGVENLQRDPAIMFRIAREIDRGHSSTADLAFDIVPTGESRSQLLNTETAQNTTAGIVTSIVLSPRDRRSALNLARSLCTRVCSAACVSRVCVASTWPTARCWDVGAKSEIHRLMVDLAARGLAIVMISSELPEVLGMSDRVAVLRGGAVAGILPRAEATQEKVMALALGHAEGAAA